MFFAPALSFVWAGFEDIGAGRVVLLADSNVLSAIENSGSNDNGVWFNNVAAAADNCLIPPANAIAWWRAENTAGDSLGSNHGNLLGGASFADGIVGRAFSFDGSDDREVLRKQIMESLSSPELKGRGISPHLHYFIEKMVAKEVDDRYQGWAELVGDIRAQLAGREELDFTRDTRQNRPGRRG